MAKPDTQLAILGAGDKRLEAAAREASARYPGFVAGQIAYDEALSHLVEQELQLPDAVAL